MDPDVSTSSCSDASDSDDTDSEPDIVQPPSLDLGISKLEVEVNDGCLGVQLDPCPLPLSSRSSQAGQLAPGLFLRKDILESSSG